MQDKGVNMLELALGYCTGKFGDTAGCNGDDGVVQVLQSGSVLLRAHAPQRHHNGLGAVGMQANLTPQPPQWHTTPSQAPNSQ